MNKILICLIASSLFSFMSQPTWAEQNSYWTLNSSIQQAMKVAPEVKVADAEIGRQRGNLEQAGAWPNPSVSVLVDDTLGLEDNRGGYDATQFSISQSLPITRLSHQREQAEAELASVQAQQRYQHLLLELKVAKNFHILQLAKAKLKLANDRVLQANRFQAPGSEGRKTDPLVRYLTPLETMRLDIVLQSAKQTLKIAESKYKKNRASFKSLLAIPDGKRIRLTSLEPVLVPSEYKNMGNALSQSHPLLEINKQALASAQAGVAVAKSKRFDDPVITLFQGQDFLGGRRQDTNGIMLSIQIPLWNFNSGSIKQAQQTVRRTQARTEITRRDLLISFRNSYLQLGRFINQADHYRNKLLLPAKKVFKLTRKGFNAGQVNVLTLIDANSTYFDAQERYLEILQQGWQELAELRKSAGLSALVNNFGTRIKTGEGK